MEAVKVRRFPAMQTATPSGLRNGAGGRMVVVLVVDVVDVVSGTLSVVVVDVVDVVSGTLSAVVAITSR